MPSLIRHQNKILKRREKLTLTESTHNSDVDLNGCHIPNVSTTCDQKFFIQRLSQSPTYGQTRDHVSLDILQCHLADSGGHKKGATFPFFFIPSRQNEIAAPLEKRDTDRKRKRGGAIHAR